MRSLLTFFIFLPFLLNAQSSQYVFPKHFGQGNKITVDEDNGDFYLEYLDRRTLSSEPELYAYDPEGQLRWQRQFLQFPNFVPSRDPDRTALFDLGNNRLLYLGAPANECDVLYNNVIALLLDKIDGHTVDSISVSGFDAILLNPSIKNAYGFSINAEKDRVVFSAQQQLWQLSIAADVLSLTSLQMDFEDVAPVYLTGDSIAYAFPGGNPSELILRDLGTNVSISYPLPDFLTDEVAIAAGGAVLLATADSLYRFNFTTVSTEVIGPLQYDTYKYKPGYILFHDREAEQYTRYFITSDSLGQAENYFAAGAEIIDLDFHQGDYLLSGIHQFEGSRRRFGFWHRETGTTPTLTTNRGVEMAGFSLDSLLFFAANPPDPITGLSGASSRFMYSAKIVNLGMEPLDSVLLEFPVQGSFNCGPLPSKMFAVDFPPLMPGDTFVYQDSIRISRPYRPDGVYNLSTRACVGRPNGELDLTYNDNCGSAAVQYILVNAQDFNPRQARQLKVSPNPADGLWTISDLPDGPIQWQLYDLNGRRVASGTWLPGPSQQRLEFPELTSGLYFLTARGEAGVYQAKLMKR